MKTDKLYRGRFSQAGYSAGIGKALAGRFRVSAALALACAVVGLFASTAHAQFLPGTPGHISYTVNPTEGSLSQSVQLPAQPLKLQNPPDVMVAPSLISRLQSTPWAQDILAHQWTPASEIPGEQLFSEAYMRTRDDEARSLDLKTAIYLALKNNPGIRAASLEPVISMQAVRQSWAVFDPSFTAQADETKNVTPANSTFLYNGALSAVSKSYDWNFGINKVLATTNGTLGITFDNDRTATNSFLASVNPTYVPLLAMSLNQPLLRNFGNQFATINVSIAAANQRQAQFAYEQQLNDFVLKVGTDYWNLVRAEMNLEVAKQALAVDEDLVRQNTISVNVGVMAPLQLKEAQSQAATDQANVYTAEGNLVSARATLREDVMYNPKGAFMPAPIEVSERPHPNEMPSNEERSLELAMMYRPELAALRQAIQSLLLQVKYAENQTLPELNLGAQFGITSAAGAINCGVQVGGQTIPCVQADGSPGSALPFKGLYPEALDRLFRFTWYNYAIVFSFERPFNNDAAKAALAQAKTTYEQERMLYRNQVSNVVLDVEQSLAGQSANFKAAQAAKIATDTAAAALHDERETFRVGMATTHDLLQYIGSLVAAEGNQVQAEVNFEISKLQVLHAQGTLLRSLNIVFIPQNPDMRPWYAHF